MSDCKTSPPTNPLKCSFDANVGDTITLEVKGVVGDIQFQSAKYNGQDLLPNGPAKQIIFKVVQGQGGPQTLLVVAYNFLPPDQATGTLNEVCTDNPKLDDLNWNVTSKFYRVCPNGTL
jgi:hypothetical protein